jgi:hypothetical protein
MTGLELLTRRRLVQTGLAGLAALVRVVPARAHEAAVLLGGVRLTTRAPFAGDHTTLATVGRDPLRRVISVRFKLIRPAAVTLEVVETGQGVASERPVTAGQAGINTRTWRLPADEHTLTWEPSANQPARTYILRLTAQHGARTVREHAVVRLLGIDAGFLSPSALPGTTAPLVVRTDAKGLQLQLLRCGLETVPTYANNVMNGIPVEGPRTLDWRNHRNAPAEVYVPIPAGLPTGIYCARLDSDDGRTGFAPLVVPPTTPTQRVAVVVPTTTWQAYNFYDADGDGWGDTWYARWKTMHVDMRRPHANRGVPYRFRSYELAFYHWLAQRGIQVDMYGDPDLERFADPDALRAAYDLLVFPGHTEYVTGRLYDLISGFRDRGGNLLFLSANNFFRRVDRNTEGTTAHLIDEWRNLGRPEAALCGVQYLASDRGQRHAPFVVSGADQVPWAFDGTGLANGSTFGSYGIEIDARTPDSPPGTTVLATIPDLFGAGRTAEMTYYEHPSGARVFSAGALNFGGQVLLWPQTTQLLGNVWQRLAQV